MRLVDADALAEVINKMVEDCIEGNALTFFKLGIRGGLNDAYRAVINFPTLDYAPVVHGEWVDGEHVEWTRWMCKCSLCGDEQDFMTNFCPNCGAKMDGGKKDV